MLGHGGRKSDTSALAMLADPPKGMKQLAEQAAALEKERKKAERAVRNAGGLAKIETLKAEAEKALEGANAKAAEIIRAADRQTVARRDEVSMRETAAADREDEIKRRTESQAAFIARRRAELDQEAAQLAKDKRAAAQAAKDAMSATAAAKRKAAECETLANQLQAKWEQTQRIWA